MKSLAAAYAYDLELDRALKFWTVRPKSGRLAALPLLVAFLLSSNSGARFLALPLLSLSPPLILIKRHVSEVPPRCCRGRPRLQLG